MTRLLLILGFFISTSVMAQLPGFTLTGNPESLNGATWTFQQTINGIFYDLKGILFKPIGAGVFPSVIVNHGTSGNTNPNGYSDRVCKKMVTWGYVCIAVNLTHSGGGAPCGSPGTCDTANWGASNDNFLRVMKCWDILASLAYTDTKCIAAFGHSRGAFLSTGLLGKYPDKFSCAGHTAGGVGHPTDLTYPTSTMVNSITKPYILHHGTSDNIVDISYDNNIAAIFSTNGVTHQYYTYTGYTHNSISQDSLMFSRTRIFFNQHICNTITAINERPFDKRHIFIYPNPSSNYILINSENIIELQIFSLTGQLLLAKVASPHEKIDISFLSNGIYLVRMKVGNEIFSQNIIITK
jgi:dienelactone hydrolase